MTPMKKYLFLGAFRY